MGIGAMGLPALSPVLGYPGSRGGPPWSIGAMFGGGTALLLSRDCVPGIREALSDWREARTARRDAGDAPLRLVWYGAW